MGIKTNFQLVGLNLDVSAYEKELRAEMTLEIKEAAKDWLATVISIVPVWSRASHATFKPLADAVGFTIPTQPLIAKKDRSGLGESASKGRLELDNNKFFFVYETSLEYLAANNLLHVEFPDHGIFSPKGLKTPTPFNFTQIAAEQFKNRASRLPNPFDFLRLKKV